MEALCCGTLLIDLFIYLFISGQGSWSELNGGKKINGGRYGANQDFEVRGFNFTKYKKVQGLWIFLHRKHVQMASRIEQVISAHSCYFESRCKYAHLPGLSTSSPCNRSPRVKSVGWYLGLCQAHVRLRLTTIAMGSSLWESFTRDTWMRLPSGSTWWTNLAVALENMTSARENYRKLMEIFFFPLIWLNQFPKVIFSSKQNLGGCPESRKKVPWMPPHWCNHTCNDNTLTTSVGLWHNGFQF